SGVVGLLDLDWRVDDEARKIDAAQYPEVRVVYESKPGQVQEVGRAPAGPVYGLGREVRQRIRELEKPATDQLAAQLLFSVEHRDGVVTIRKEPKIKRSEVRSSLLDSPADSIDLSLFPDITGQMSYSVFNGVYPRIESMEKTYREWLRSKSFVKDGLLPSLVRHQQQWAQKKAVRVLGIGSGSGLDAMAVLYQLFKEPAIQSIDYYLIDISMKAVENTRYNLVQQLTALGWDFKLITKGEGSYEIDLKQKGRILIGRVHEGYEFKELDQLNGGKNAGSFDYVFFNTPVLVRPTQQPGFLAMSSVSSAAASFIFQQMAPKFDTALGMNITTFQNMLSELNRRLEPSGKALLVARVQDHQDIRNTLLPNQLLDIVGQEGNPEPLTDEEALEQRHFFEISTFNPDAGIKTGHSEIKTAHYVDVLRQLNPTDQRKPGELTIDHDHWIEAIRYPALYDLLSKFGGDFSGDVLKVLVLGPGRKRIASSGKARSHSPQMVEILTALSDRKAEYTVVDGDPAVLLAAVNPQWYQITGAEFSHASPHFKLKLRKSLKGITERNFLSRLRRGDNTFRVDPKLISQTKIDSYWGFFENLEYGEEQLDVVIATTSLLYALGSFETVEASLDFTARLIWALKPGGKIFLSKSTLYKGLTLRGNAETGLESNFEKTDLKTWRAQEAIVAQTLGLPKISWNQRIAYELEQRLGFKVDIAETGGIQVLTREPMRSEVRMISSYQLGEAFGTDYVGPTFSGGRNEDFLYEDGKKIAVRLPWAKYVFRALNKDGREIPDRVFKITYYADENEKLFREASNMFSLQQDPAVSGVVRLVRTGMLKNGGMWMEQESIASARSLEREIFGKVARVFEILIRAGEIVKSVHARGLVHADLKPDQFLINDNQDLQLIDFGNAQPMHSALDDRAEHTIGYVPVDEDGQFIMDDLAEDTDAYSFIVMVAKLLDQQTQTDTAGLESTLHRMRDEYMHMIFKEWKFEHFQELWNVGNPLSRITPHPRKKWPRSMEPVLEKLKGDLEIVRTFQQQVTPKSEVRSAAQFVEGRRSLLALPEDRLTPKDVSLILTHTAGASGDAPYDNKQAVLPAVEKLLRSGLFLSNQTFEYVFPGHPSYLEPDLERIVLMQNPNVSREEMYKIPNLSARVFVLTGGGFQQNYVRSSKNLQQGENECQYCAYYAYSNLLQMSAETQGLFSDPFEVHLAADALYSHSSEFYGGGDGWWIESHPTHPEKLQQGFRLGFHPAIEALSLAYRTVAIQDGQMLVLTQNHDQPRLINYLWASTDEMLAHFEKRIERGETDQAVRSEVRKSVAAAEMRHVKKIESFSTPTGVFLDANDLAGVSENHVEAQLDEIMALLSKHKYFDLYVQGDVDLIHNRRFRELLEQYRSRIHFGIMESRASLQQKKILVKASFLESRDTETETRFKLKKLKKDYGVTQDLTPVEYTRAGALKGFLDLAESLTAEEIRDLPARYAVRTASGYLRLTENYLDAVWQDLQNSYVFAWSA
ncbi:MAG: hypothetical protein KBC91_02020, partial [Candidatus Omnitrophica bacterium]|nr:hypothetical protein [Candidatus Omnitrophota bacterium]